MADDERVELQGSENRNAMGSPLGAPSDPIRVSVLLAPPKPLPSLEELLDAAKSHDAAHYDAHPDAVAQVEAFAADNGLKVIDTDRQTRLVELEGTPDALAEAFGIDLELYDDGARTYHSHRKPVSLPASIADKVSWVFGLDESVALQATTFRGGHLCGAAASSGLERAAAVAVPSELVSYSVPELAKLYDFPEGTGKGRCVGIIALAGGYTQGDLDAYFESLGLATPQVVTLQENQSADPISDYQVTQDIQIAGAVVPEARIALYNVNSSGQTVRDFYKAFAAAIHDDDNRPEVIINPWVFTENPVGLPGLGVGPEWIERFEQLFRVAAIKGITVCSASGSMGAMYPIGIITADTSTQAPKAIAGLALPYANYPPTSPLNLAIGGTTLYAKGGHREELVWNRLQNPMSVNGTPYNGGATGGGLSYLLPRPGYQESAGVPEGRSYSWDNGRFQRVASFVGRGVPDVSIDADTFTGYQLYFEGAWGIGGGTGVSVPLWGALVLLLNAHVGRRLGWLNPVLYELQLRRGAEVFTAIAGGNNGAYEAPVGEPWNPCTGLGVPQGKKLAAALAALPAPKAEG